MPALAAIPTRTDYAAEITATWRKSLEGILRVGRLLAEAKAALSKADYDAMVESELPFGSRAAYALMQIANHPILGDVKHAAILPPAWSTLAELAKLPDAVLIEAVANGKIHADMDRVQVHRLNPAADRTTPVQFRCPFCASEKIRLIDSEPTPIEHSGVSFYHQTLYACRECERITHCASAILGESHKRYISKEGN